MPSTVRARSAPAATRNNVADYDVVVMNFVPSLVDEGLAERVDANALPSEWQFSGYSLNYRDVVKEGYLEKIELYDNSGGRDQPPRLFARKERGKDEEVLHGSLYPRRRHRAGT